MLDRYAGPPPAHRELLARLAVARRAADDACPVGMAGQLFAASGLPAAQLGRARPLWTILGRELIAGEYLEVLRTGAEPDIAASLRR